VKEYTPTLATLAALVLILSTLVILSIYGQKSDGPVVLGLVAAAGTTAGALAGMSNQQQRKDPPPTISDSPGAVINPNPKEPAL
jgi:hypothetical protein